jgi:hypothetical protein
LAEIFHSDEFMQWACMPHEKHLPENIVLTEDEAIHRGEMIDIFLISYLALLQDTLRATALVTKWHKALREMGAFQV